MKLINYLLSESKKGWKWPNNVVKAVVMEGGRGVNFYFGYTCPPSLSETLISPHPFTSAEVVTRQQYEAALAASKQEWDGEGLPPVGCECMVRGEIGDDGWYECKVIAHTFFDGYNCAVFQTESTVSCSSEGNFRPIRSEADKKKEAVLSQIANAIIGDVPDTGMATAAMYAERIYGAIKSGKIVID
ncbi:hypothetical protein QCK34_002820 [Enterobacter asburiae]|nr:hypothetical protein [Enterobacter asburiae]